MQNYNSYKNRPGPITAFKEVNKNVLITNRPQGNFNREIKTT